MQALLLTAKALVDPTRVRLLLALRERELCVCELCDALQLSQSTVSTHLQVIREAGLVRTRKVGKWIYYAPEPAKRRLLAGIFRFYSADLAAHALLQSDGERLTLRLAERENGACCRGFGNESCPPRRARRPLVKRA